MAIFFKSAATYNYLRENLSFKLPSLASIYKWIPLHEVLPGVDNDDLFHKLKDHIENFSTKSKQVLLCVDEMHIFKKLEYNNKSDFVEGFVDYGKERTEATFGKVVCTFMIRSIRENWKQVIGYVVAATSTPAYVLEDLITNYIRKCFSIGLCVKGVVCDQGSTNQSVFKSLGITEANPYFMVDDKKVVGIYDVPHLIKSIRNNLLKYDIQIDTKTVSWRVIKELYQIDSTSMVRLAPKLTPIHIAPNNFQKMKVSYATQIFSASVASAIRTTQKLNLFSKEVSKIANDTADFVEKINDIFDILNSKSSINALKVDENYKGKLEECVSYLSQITYITNNSKTKIACVKGLQQSIRGIMLIANDLFSGGNWQYICTNRFNQDPLENLFSIVRYKKRKPSVKEFREILKRIMSVKLIYGSKYANCKEDVNDMLVDWKAVLTISDSTDEQNDLNTDETTIDDNAELKGNNQEIDLQIPTKCMDLSDNALKYFCGYVIHQKIGNPLPNINNETQLLNNCSNCLENLTIYNSKLTAPSDWLTFFKNYNENSHFGSLKMPTNEFFNVCKSALTIFSTIFTKEPYNNNIKQKIVQEVLLSSKKFFDPNNLCVDHRIQLLDFLILVLLRKNCRWLSEKINFESGNNQMVHNKLALLA